MIHTFPGYLNQPAPARTAPYGRIFISLTGLPEWFLWLSAYTMNRQNARLE